MLTLIISIGVTIVSATPMQSAFGAGNAAISAKQGPVVMAAEDRIRLLNSGISSRPDAKGALAELQAACITALAATRSNATGVAARVAPQCADVGFKVVPASPQSGWYTRKPIAF